MIDDHLSVQEIQHIYNNEIMLKPNERTKHCQIDGIMPRVSQPSNPATTATAEISLVHE